MSQNKDSGQAQPQQGTTDRADKLTSVRLDTAKRLAIIEAQLQELAANVRTLGAVVSA